MQRVPNSYCLACGQLLDALTLPTSDTAPEAGDFTICFYCGHLMAFAADKTLRNLTDAEMIEVAGDSAILTIQRARGALIKQQLKKNKGN